MKKNILGYAFILAACLSTAQAADWYAPQEPFRVVGNTYYVGTGGISAVLITSPAGHILIDAGGPEATPQVVAHIRQLGFRVEDIRYILNSHEHFDHAGAIADLQRLSGATVLASPAAAQVLHSGQPDKADAQYPNLQPMPPIARTRAVRDGEVVRLGPLAVTAHLTPGHTRGGTSWTWRSEDGGRSMDVVYADSLTAIAAQGLSFSHNQAYPRAQADLEHSIATVEALPCDVLVSAHPDAGGLWERKARGAFIDAGACRSYAGKARASLDETVAAEAASASLPTGKTSL